MQPKISIIIPIYNTEKYIRRCLDSCINQTLKEIEIILIDDCTQDNSISIAQEYAKKDHRIVIVRHKKNSGTFQARNTGITQAQGLYCMFCDSDDFFDLKACEISFHSIQKHKVDILATRMQHFPKTLKRIKPHIYEGKFIGDTMRTVIAKNPDAQGLCDKIFLTQNLKSACNILCFIQKPLIFFEDGILLLVTSFYAKNFYGQKNITYYYCSDNKSSATRQIDIKNLHKKYINLAYILEISQELKKIFPHYAVFIESFSKKTASTLILESRFFTTIEFASANKILKKYNFTKKLICPNIYLKSVFLSLRYHFRWQNIIRAIAYIVSFGKIKI